MIKTTAMLIDDYKEYRNPKAKIGRLVKNGMLFSIKRGIYETEARTDGRFLASFIMSPSYLSFEFALASYGLIPERTITFTSATVGKRKKKVFENRFGRFTYEDIPLTAYRFGIKYDIVANYPLLMATPEKALCDMLYKLPPVNGIKELDYLLFVDMRIDEALFKKMERNDLLHLAGLYGRSSNHLYLRKLLNKRG